MSKKQIIIVLAAPGNGGERVAACLAAYKETKKGQKDDLDTALQTSLDEGHVTRPECVFDPILERLFDDLNIAPGDTIPEDILTSSKTRRHRQDMRKTAYGLARKGFPVILAHTASASLVPFLTEAFEESEIQLRYVLVSSNALQVHDALIEDDPASRFNPAAPMLTWSASMVNALKLANTSDPGLFHLNYSAFLARPRKTLYALLEALDMKRCSGSETHIDDIAGIISRLDQSDRAYTGKDVERHEDFPVFIRDLNALLEGLPHCETIEGEKTLSKIKPFIAGFDDFSFFANTSQKDTKRSEELLAQSRDNDEQKALLESTNNELLEKISTLTNNNEKLEEDQSRAKARIDELLIELETARNSNNEQIGILSEKNQQLTLTVEDNEEALAQMQKLMEQNRIAHDEKMRALELDNAVLNERTKGSDKLVEELRKERAHDRQRSNIERASLLKEKKLQDQVISELREKLTGPQPSSDTDTTHNETSTLPFNNTSPDQRAQIERELETRIEESERLAREKEADLTARIDSAEREIEEKTATLEELKIAAQVSRNEVDAIKSSTSWKISAPVRGLKTAAKNPAGAAKSGVRRSARLVRNIIATPFRGARSAARQFNTPTNRLQNGDLGNDDGQPGAVDFVDGHLTQNLSGCVPISAVTPPEKLEARAIAFYLPQFHTIPENDEWWGKGFTEWTNVAPAQPQFPGHYQPHIPSDLGMYNLETDEDILHRQTKMAALHGLSGFAFYFYWFGGKRLLETPLQRYLKDDTIDFPFCLCWANENWSRRWDGLDSELLISQNHSPQDDIAFISHLSQYLTDPRYIRINGKPLLLVYRPGILPNAKATSDRWREWCLKNDIGEIYIAYTQGFDKQNPTKFGFDAAIEFPPNNHHLIGTPSLLGKHRRKFKGKVFDWRDLVKRSQNYPETNYKLFRGITPSWDNTARRNNHSTVLLNSNPVDYYRWFKNAVDDTKTRFSNDQERLIFVNAWNEWAEGAHLEPDEKYGYAWLEATRRAVAPQSVSEIVPPYKNATAPQIEQTELGGESLKKKIIVVTHDLYKHGAQYLCLNFAKTLSQKFNREVHIISGEDGPLRGEFEKYAQVTILAKTEDPAKINTKLQALSIQGFDHAFMNSAASGWLGPYFSDNHISFIGLVHELPSIIHSMGLGKNLQDFQTHAKHVVFPANIVRDKATQFLREKEWHNALILPQGVYKTDAMLDWADKEKAKAKICKRLKIPKDSKIVLGVGFADHRKGIDLFLKWAIAAITNRKDLYFVWIGEIAQDMKQEVDKILKTAGRAKSRIHLPGFSTQTHDYYLAANVYALSSREDPFPSTALEALNAGTPVIMIKDTGGIEDLTPHDCVIAIENDEDASFTHAIEPLLGNPKHLQELGNKGPALIGEKFGFCSYVGDLLDVLESDEAKAPGVSVVVPNYNYERHLEKRLNSIIQQKLPPREIIFLDDASSDKSIGMAKRILSDCGIRHRIIINKENSGNVFAQWQKGVALANHDIVWIAEADDWADLDFLGKMAPQFINPDLVLAYSQSKQVNEKGKVIAENYQDYVRDISAIKWTKDFTQTGQTEITEGLAIKNTIPNVSGVLFRTNNLKKLLEKDVEFAKRFRTAGDWYVYVNLLREGNVHFNATPLNYHRRHENSVTISQFNIDDLKEIADMQRYIAKEFNLDKKERTASRAYLSYLVDHFQLTDQYSSNDIDAVISNT